ncbi:MAG: 4Fe-4S binding protein [Planctomycetota bacterium]
MIQSDLHTAKVKKGPVMGHVVNPNREYRLLQRRLDGTVTGAPDSPVLMEILERLYSPEEASLARRVPGSPTPLGVLTRVLGVAREELDDKLTAMAHRGLVFDLEHRGERYFSLSPVVIGFFEFTFMRTRDELPMAELARLFHQYMHDDERFVRSVFGGHTQIGRSLVHEESLPADDHTEVLDWERAGHIVQTASAVGVSLCSCRHKMSHLEKACDKPLRCCLSLNYAAEATIRNGVAQRITTAEAMDVLRRCKEAGLVQIGDNVKRKVTYICNCCRCCCGMIDAINTFDIRGAIVTSNWIMEVDLAKCRGCGKCAEACPVSAVEIVTSVEGEKKHKSAARDESLCLGCGVCHGACQFGGVVMRPRPKRVFTPETIFDRLVTMAVERGKLSEMIFDDPDKLSHRALRRVFGVLERSPLGKAARAVKPLRSAFLRALVWGAKRTSGELSTIVG